MPQSDVAPPLLLLSDQPPRTLSPLEADIYACDLQARAQTLAELCGGKLEDQLERRIMQLGTDGTLLVDAGLFKRLLGALVGAGIGRRHSPEDIRALRQAAALVLGVDWHWIEAALPDRPMQAGAAPNSVPSADFPKLLAALAPRMQLPEEGAAGSSLVLKARAAVGHRTPPPTGDGLLEAVARLSPPQATARRLSAALHWLWLLQEVRAVFGHQSWAALDLLGGLEGGEGKHLSATAQNHLISFESVVTSQARRVFRRGEAASWVVAMRGAREAFLALSAVVQETGEAHQAAVALAERAAAPLGLERVAALHLSVAELVTALDGAAPPEMLRAVAYARAAYTPMDGAWTLEPAALNVDAAKAEAHSSAPQPNGPDAASNAAKPTPTPRTGEPARSANTSPSSAGAANNELSRAASSPPIALGRPTAPSPRATAQFATIKPSAESARTAAPLRAQREQLPQVQPVDGAISGRVKSRHVAQWQALPLAAGTREGRLRRHNLLEHPPCAGEVALVIAGEPSVGNLAGATAVVTQGATVLSAVALQARELGQAAVCLPGASQWLQEGDLVRVSGGSGIVQLLERGQQPDGGQRSATGRGFAVVGAPRPEGEGY